MGYIDGSLIKILSQQPKATIMATIIGTILFVAFVVCYFIEEHHSKERNEALRAIEAAEHKLKMATDPAYKAFQESLEHSRYN